MSNTIIAISDLEGISIGSSVPECEKCQNNNCPCKVYICGDIIDSTLSIPTNTKENKELFEDKLNEHKIFNLRNIYDIITNDKYKLILGNRDINKIKCISLCKLKNTNNNEIIKGFNNSGINLTEDSYGQLKKAITIDPWVSNMKNWYTFWSAQIKDQKWEKKDWTNTTTYNNEPFLTRFDEIFGVDNVKGTMSAQNLLNTIPIETGIITAENIEKADKDYLAFIVLAIFNSMLQMHEPTTNDGEKIEWDMLTKTNSSFCKGWLYKLYTTSNVCECLEINNKLFLFSHGGITTDLINEVEKVKAYKNKLMEKKNDLKQLLTDADTFLQHFTQQKGGNYSETKNSIESITIIKSIKSINEIFKQSIKNIFIKSNQILGNFVEFSPNGDMLFILSMSAPFNCETKFKNNKTLCANTIDTVIYSPIQPGYANMRKNNFVSPGKTIYQIFGHQPVGFGTTIDLIEKDNNKTFLINLDKSNSFRGSATNNGESKNYIEINNDGTVLNKSEIILSGINNEILLKNIDSLDDKDLNNKFYGVNEKKFECNNNLDDLIDFIKQTVRKDNKYIVNVHGITKDEKYIFSINGSGFSKSFFALGKDKYKDFFLNETVFKTLPNNAPNVMEGGNYYDKYLKYKNKYLKLKQNL